MASQITNLRPLGTSAILHRFLVGVGMLSDIGANQFSDIEKAVGGPADSQTGRCEPRPSKPAQAANLSWLLPTTDFSFPGSSLGTHCSRGSRLGGCLRAYPEREGEAPAEPRTRELFGDSGSAGASPSLDRTLSGSPLNADFAPRSFEDNYCHQNKR